jgi:hypothetical protein
MTQNGEGPDHRGGGIEAQEFEQLGRRLEVLPTAETSLQQVRVIHAEIVGADQCHAEGHRVRGAAPVLAICRKLIAAGLDAGRPLHAYRGNTLCLVVRSIGRGAELVIDERRMAFARWRALSCAEVSSRIAPFERAATTLPGAAP